MYCMIIVMSVSNIIFEEVMRQQYAEYGPWYSTYQSKYERN